MSTLKRYGLNEPSSAFYDVYNYNLTTGFSIYPLFKVCFGYFVKLHINLCR